MNAFLSRPQLPVLLVLALLPWAPLSALTLEQALQQAEREAPALQAWQLQQQAAGHDAEAAGQLPDPKLGFGLQNIPLQGDDRGRLNADGMSMQMLGLMQEVPNRARREAQRELAQATRQRMSAELAVQRLEVRLGMAEVWLRLRVVEQQLALFPQLLEHNRVLAAAVTARLRSGQGSLAEQPQVETERAQLEQRIEQLQAEQGALQAASRRWLQSPGLQQTLGNWPQWPVEEQQLRERLQQQPELARYQPLLQQGAAAVRLAEADRRPDWSWELAYQRRGAGLDDMFSVQVNLGLPLFTGSRQQPRIRARQAELAALELERDGQQYRLLAELDGELSEYRRLQLAVRRSDEQLLPLASRRAELALADYRSGRAGLEPLLAARSAQVETQLQHLQLQGQLASSQMRLQLGWGEH